MKNYNFPDKIGLLLVYNNFPFDDLGKEIEQFFDKSAKLSGNQVISLISKHFIIQKNKLLKNFLNNYKANYKTKINNWKTKINNWRININNYKINSNN